MDYPSPIKTGSEANGGGVGDDDVGFFFPRKDRCCPYRSWCRREIRRQWRSASLLRHRHLLLLPFPRKRQVQESPYFPLRSSTPRSPHRFQLERYPWSSDLGFPPTWVSRAAWESGERGWYEDDPDYACWVQVVPKWLGCLELGDGIKDYGLGISTAFLSPHFTCYLIAIENIIFCVCNYISNKASQRREWANAQGQGPNVLATIGKRKNDSFSGAWFIHPCPGSLSVYSCIYLFIVGMSANLFTKQTLELRQQERICLSAKLKESR